jgi:hypothetical protein
LAGSGVILDPQKRATAGGIASKKVPATVVSVLDVFPVLSLTKSAGRGWSGIGVVQMDDSRGRSVPEGVEKVAPRLGRLRRDS